MERKSRLINTDTLVLRPKRLIPGEGRKRLEKTGYQQRLDQGSGLVLGNQER
jgi:hypothetical protein